MLARHPCFTKKKLSPIFVFFLLLYNSALAAQNIKIELNFNKKDLNINYSPFDKVIVLDNRFDSSRVFNFQDGAWPPRYKSFGRPTSDAIKDYLSGAIEHISTGDKTLLVNVRQLWIGNTPEFIKEKSDPLSNKLFYIRDRIMIYLDVYVGDKENQYKKIESINKNYPVPTTKILPLILNNLLESASFADTVCKKGLSDKKRNMLASMFNDKNDFYYSKDTITYSLEQINVNVRENWGAYPINQSNETEMGFYDNFEDFKNGLLTKAKVEVTLSSIDSVYKVSNEDQFSRKKQKRYKYPVYAIRDSVGNFYINFFGRYLKAEKQKNTFHFKIPHTMPNIYYLLSVVNVNKASETPYINNFFAELAFLGVDAAVKSVRNKNSEKEMELYRMSDEFRNCYVDMDSGDIIY